MKIIITFLLLLFGMSTVQAQKIIYLDPANLNYASDKVVPTYGSEALLNVKENYANEFLNNPIRFIEKNFDVSMIDMTGFDEVEVSFLSSKGYLKATYNNDGKLLRTSQQFKNIALPPAIRTQLYGENQGWVMVSNKYTATGKENRINKELYKFKLEKGKLSKRYKIQPVVEAGGRVAIK